MRMAGMMPKAQRVLKVLILLHQQPQRAADLAELFGVSTRTILRDVMTLRAAGIDVKTSTGSGGGTWVNRCDVFKDGNKQRKEERRA